MKMMYKLGLALFILMASSMSLFAQNRFFQDVPERSIQTGNAKRVIVPGKYRSVSAQTAQLRNFLWALPSERSVTDRRSVPVISLPMPDGSTARFHVWESSIQAPGLEAKFPEIKTFLGQGIDDPHATLRMDFNPYFGFHAQILSVNGNVYIDPYARGNTEFYISYNTTDLNRDPGFHCETVEEPVMGRGDGVNAGPCRGTQLYTYRLAVACTGEYAQAVGGVTPAALHAAIVTTVNRVVGVYEKEIAVRLILVDNNNLVEFLDPSLDPFNGNNNAGTLINESQTVITANIGTANFDIGHTFSTGGGGLAGLGVVCSATSKARGITGSPSPVGDAYDIDYVAHEIGHQFGGSHTFNSITSSCGGGNRSAANAYEVGSGTTIQAYAGICSSDNIQPNSDPYFHAVSFDQISNFLEAGGASCRNVIATGNTLPVITAMNNNGANIPLGTPFVLTATATDADGDAISYNWEGWDRTASGGAWNSGATSTTAPLFKSRIPKTSGSRTFPDMAVILANYPSAPAATMGGLKGETLPQVGREMKFRLTVRDNRAGGGGVVSGGDGCQSNMTGMFTINAISGTGPFLVNVPNGGESYPGGTTQTVSWSVAGTDLAPISVSNVRITLSTDGGNTYPTVLIASTPNDGSEVVTMPSVITSTARVRIEAVGNIFFDISNANFSITGAVSGFTFTNPAAAAVACGSASASITLGTNVVGGFSTPINLSASGMPAGTTISFGTNPVTPGNSSVVTLNGMNTLSAGNYQVTITGTAGSVSQTRVLTYTVNPGTAPVITTQPQSQQICEGTPVTFTVASNASSHQWQVSTDNGANWFNIGSATSTSFTLPVVTTAQNNNRYRVIANAQCGSTTSTEATLTVRTTPTITAQPLNVTTCAGSNHNFTANATGTGISYQWQVSTDGGASYNNVAGATAATLGLTNITGTMNGNQYRVVVTGTCSPAATSNAAVLSVIGITTQPTNVTICATGTTTFSAAATGNNLQYQWQVSTDGGTNYTDLAGATNSTLTLNNVTAGMNNNRYRVQVYTTACSNRTSSNGAILSVNERPAVTLSAQPGTSLVPGQKTVITANFVPPTSGTVVIRWFRNGVLIADSTNNTITVDVTKLGDYKAEITYLPSNCNNESAVLSITAAESTRFFIYPIPNNGRFTVSYYNSSTTDVKRTVTVFNAQGALMYREEREGINTPYYLWQVNMPQAAAGVYLVVLADGNGNKIATGKVVIGR